MFLLSIITLLLILGELLYFLIADKFNIIDKPNLRSSHEVVTLRGGGIIFLLGVEIYFLFYGISYPWFLAGLLAIGSISFIDDVCSVSNKVRLMVHFISLILMYQDLNIWQLNGGWEIIICLILGVGILNAYNFMDGINGMTGGYSLAVLFPLWYVNRQLHFIENSLLEVVIISVFIFCFFNFRRQAKCFAGDVGAIGMAFIILFVMGKLIRQTGDFTYILFLAVYGVDTVLTILHRIRLHENIGQAHRKHVYQLMANELKIPHVQVSSIYAGLQLLISFGLLAVPVHKEGYFFSVLSVLIVTYILFKKKYYHLHEAYLKAKDG